MPPPCREHCRRISEAQRGKMRTPVLALAALVPLVASTLYPASSNYSQRNRDYTNDLAELGRYYRHYQALMAHWHHVFPPGHILDVRYEDVVANSECPARTLLIAGLTGIRVVLSFIKRSGRFAPRARRSCASRFTTVRSDAGACTSRPSGRCSRSWAMWAGSNPITRLQ